MVPWIKKKGVQWAIGDGVNMEHMLEFLGISGGILGSRGDLVFFLEILSVCFFLWFFSVFQLYEKGPSSESWEMLSAWPTGPKVRVCCCPVPSLQPGDGVDGRVLMG